MDAPIGYMASLQNLCNQRDDLNFDTFWAPDSSAEVHHFIGKDIVNFHALFWPAVLSGAGFRTPSRIHTHGFVTVNGTKMSKSRGTFILAKRYLEHLNPEYLRYYYATKLSDSAAADGLVLLTLGSQGVGRWAFIDGEVVQCGWCRSGPAVSMYWLGV